MKYIFTLFFALSINWGLCQELSPSKHQLSKLFKLSIDQESKKTISVGNNAWTICNQDSSFFKSDTIRIYSNINYFYQKGACCKFIQWTFYKKNAFVQSDLQVCIEPSSSSILNKYYTIEFLSGKKELYLFILNSDNAFELFRVINLQEIKLAQNNSTKIIALKRMTTKNPIVGLSI